MLSIIFDIVAPVFLVIGAGYLAARRGLLSGNMIDGLMKFAIQFAVPCLLFRATSTMDLGTAYDWRLMSAFYIGSTTSFAVATLLARNLFGRSPGESVAVGFCALFSNLVLLGLLSRSAPGVPTQPLWQRLMPSFPSMHPFVICWASQAWSYCGPTGDPCPTPLQWFCVRCFATAS